MKKNVATIFLLSLVLFIPWLGTKRFHTRGEAREALAIQSIFEEKDWIVPEGYGQKVASKPPMLHWIGAIASQVVGEVNEFTSRFPSAFTSIGFLMLWFLIIQKIVGERVAILSVFILLTSFEWFRLSTTCRVDMVHSGFLAAGLLGLYLFIEGQARGGWLAIIGISGAFLAKGPVAVVIPALVALFFCRKDQYKRVFFIIGAGAILPAVWYIAAFKFGGSDFLRMFIDENFARFTGTLAGHPHKASAFYLWFSIVIGFLPWTLLILPQYISQSAFPRLSSYKDEFLILSAGERPANRIKRFLLDLWRISSENFRELNSFKQFSLIVTLVTLGFYSVPEGKRSVYLLAAYPFISIFLASYLLQLQSRGHKLLGNLVIALTLVFLMILLVGLGFIFLAPLMTSDPKILFFAEIYRNGLEGLSLVQSLLLLAPLVTGAWIILKWSQSYRRSFIPFAFYFFYSWFLAISAVFAPIYGNAISSYGFASAINREFDKSIQLYSFKYEFYGISFYAKRNLVSKEENFSDGDHVILYESDLPALRDRWTGEIETLLRSKRSIENPLQYVIVVRLKHV